MKRQTLRLGLAIASCLMAVAAIVHTTGCASFGIPQAESFRDRLAYAYSAHTAIQNAAANSLNAKEITSADAEHVLKIADESRAVLDAARAATDAGDTSTAEGRLLLATSILTQLQTFLRNKGGGP